MSKETYYCPNCKQDTEQEEYFTNHERDSSQDMRECLTCGWYRFLYWDYYKHPEENRKLSIYDN